MEARQECINLILYSPVQVEVDAQLNPFEFVFISHLKVAPVWTQINLFTSAKEVLVHRELLLQLSEVVFNSPGK